MPKTRYFKTTEQLNKATSQNQDVASSIVSNIVIDYRSDPEAVAECVPPNLSPNTEGLVRVTLSNVDVQLGAMNFEFGSVSVNIPCEHEGEPGDYCLHMYMNQETPVVAGREIYGEPKKIADIEFSRQDGALEFTATRHYCPIIQFKGRISGEPLPVAKNEQTMFVYKAFPALDGNDFEYPPRLNRLLIETEQSELFNVEGELVLTESPLDPIADLPVNSIVRIQLVREYTAPGIFPFTSCTFASNPSMPVTSIDGPTKRTSGASAFSRYPRTWLASGSCHAASI